MSGDTKVVIGIGIITVAIVAGILIFGSKPNIPTIVAKTVEKGELVRDTSEKTGPTDAKVTFVEFGDFQCPACAQFYTVVDKIKSDYSSKVQFVFRNYPLSIHANAQSSARASEAAGNQGKFWEMYDLIYKNQSQWSYQLNPTSTFQDYAKQLGLDANQYKQDLTSSTLADRIAQDMGDGDALGVDATPTVYINGSKIDSLSDQVLRSKIDELLK
jgi:protein-disulfide isomerase